MLKRLMAMLTAGAAAVCLCSCSLTYREPKEVDKSVPVPPKMVFLGDSIPAGFGLEGYSKEDLYSCPSYPNILGEDYSRLLADECGHETINRAVSGDTSQDLIDLLDSGELDRDLEGSDAVVVSIGGNDVLNIILAAAKSLGWNRKTHEIDLDKLDWKEALSSLATMGEDIDAALGVFEKNLPEIIDRLDRRTEGEIFVQTLYDPVEHFEELSLLVNYADEKIDLFNDIVRSCAEKDGEERYKVIDIGGQFEGRNSQLTNMADLDIHPNAEGHRVIAEAVDRELRKGSYSYRVTVEGEPKLTGEAKALIAGGAAAALLIFAGIVTAMIRRKRT